MGGNFTWQAPDGAQRRRLGPIFAGQSRPASRAGLSEDRRGEARGNRPEQPVPVLAEPRFRAEVERLADEFRQDPTEALDAQAAAALASVLADPGATNSEKIRAAIAVERLLASGAKKHSAAAPVGEQQKRRLVVTEMPADPDPDAEYEVATPEQRAAFRKGFEKAAKHRFPEGTDQSEIDAWVDQSVQRLCITIAPDSGGRRRSRRAS
jgi:hypothetical protein